MKDEANTETFHLLFFKTCHSAMDCRSFFDTALCNTHGKQNLVSDVYCENLPGGTEAQSRICRQWVMVPALATQVHVFHVTPC